MIQKGSIHLNARKYYSITGQPQGANRVYLTMLRRGRGDSSDRGQAIAPTMDGLREPLRKHSRGAPLWSPYCCCWVAGLLVALVISIGFLFPGSALASSIANTDAPSLEVHAGFGAYFRDGAWVPLYITLRNDGNDFRGTLQASNAESPIWQDTFTMIPASIYQQPVTLAHGGKKQYTMYLPMASYPSRVSITVQLLNNKEKVVQSQDVLMQQLFPGDVLVGRFQISKPALNRSRL